MHRKVSIIAPVYKVENYLGECIESILSQTFKDFELILVDDGSPDGSGNIIDSYAAADGRIVAIHQPNGGQSSARNAGLEAATGEYVYMVDSDDILDPRLLETVIPEMEKGYDMVFFRFRTLLPGGEAVVTRDAGASERGELVLDTPRLRYDFLAGPFRRRAVRWEVWNRVYRRDLIERWHIRFPSDRRAYPEDMFFNLCYVAHLSRILLVPDVLYTYRKHCESISSTVFNSSRNLMVTSSNLIAEALLAHYRSCEDCRYLYDNSGPLYFLLHKAAVRRLRNYQWGNHLSMDEARRILCDCIENHPLFVSRMKESYDSPVVRESYRKDKKAVRQITDRLYLGVLLDMPGSRLRKALRKGALYVFHSAYRILTR